MSYSHKIVAVILLSGLIFISSNPVVDANNKTSSNATSSGYSALKLFLEDEQYLTTIRRTKMMISFSGISDDSAKLIDDISISSEQALVDMEKLASSKPRIIFVEFSDNQIGKATFDSLRYTEGKEFLLESDFEKNLLISQLKVLRVISHLASELEEKETNKKRKVWLAKLALRYESYYQKVIARISISGKEKT